MPLWGAAGRSVGAMLECALGCSPLVRHLGETVGRPRLLRWSEAIALLMRLMLERRNPGTLDAPLERVCGGASPFDLGRAFNEWLVG